MRATLEQIAALASDLSTDELLEVVAALVERLPQTDAGLGARLDLWATDEQIAEYGVPQTVEGTAGTWGKVRRQVGPLTLDVCTPQRPKKARAA